MAPSTRSTVPALSVGAASGARSRSRQPMTLERPTTLREPTSARPPVPRARSTHWSATTRARQACWISAEPRFMPQCGQVATPSSIEPRQLRQRRESANVMGKLSRAARAYPCIGALSPHGRGAAPCASAPPAGVPRASPAPPRPCRTARNFTRLPSGLPSVHSK